MSVDTDAPVISMCPDSQIVNVPFGSAITPVTWIEPTAFDNSGQQPFVTKSHEPGQNFAVGTTQVTYTFTDSSQNQAQCTFTITGKYDFLMSV